MMANYFICSIEHKVKTWFQEWGYAVSLDGVHFNRMERPVFEPPQHQNELYGVEDPRLTFF